MSLSKASCTPLTFFLDLPWGEFLRWAADADLIEGSLDDE